MINKGVVPSVMAMPLATRGFSFVQSYADRNDRGRNVQRQYGGQPDRREYRGGANNDGRPEECGAGPYHEFRIGDRLPPEYRERHYVVDDWRGRNLGAPPSGYHWVRTGGDHVLVAITTGIILQLMLSR